MGVVDTTYTFSSTDTITSSKLNNIIDDTFFTSTAISGSTLQIVSPGKLAIAAGGVTSNELASSVSSGLLPSGAIMPFAMNTAPTGWLAANGDVIPNGSGTVQGKTADFSALYALIGITYGTAGTLPDLRGYFVRGSGTNSDGTAAGTFGAKQADELKSHTHTMYIHPSTGSGGNSGAARFTDLSLGTGTTQASGGSETRPKNIAMLYCIKI